MTDKMHTLAEFMELVPYKDPRRLYTFIRNGIIEKAVLVSNPNGKGRISKYPDESVRRLRIAYRLGQSGMSLKQIREHLDAGSYADSGRYKPITHSEVSADRLDRIGFEVEGKMSLKASELILERILDFAKTSLRLEHIEMIRLSISIRDIEYSGQILASGFNPVIYIRFDECLILPDIAVAMRMPKDSMYLHPITIIPLAPCINEVLHAVRKPPVMPKYEPAHFVRVARDISEARGSVKPEQHLRVVDHKGEIVLCSASSLDQDHDA